MSPDRSIRTHTAMRILSALDEAGIDHCVLRNHEDIPKSPGRDIDLIASDKSLPWIEGVVASVASEDGWSQVLRCRGHHEGTSFYLIEQQHNSVVQLEMHFTRVRWAGIPILEQEDVLRSRYRSESGLWIAHPSHLAVQRLLQFGFSDQFEDMKTGYWDELRETIGTHGESVKSELNRLLGDRSLARRITDAVENDQPTEAAQEISNHRSTFVMRRIRERSLTVTEILDRVGSKAFEPRRPAKCGVVAVLPAGTPIEELRLASSPLFLNIEALDGRSLNRASIRHVVRTVNRAGAAFVTSEDPAKAAQHPAWRNVSQLINTDSVETGLDLIVQRFAANHTTVRDVTRNQSSSSKD